eukprot:CAMPEP_0172579216 /NCGR_PEP_ID=MMETSP1067-20121228/139130_1 /TAXON_ID=265564 ORGANISM="Thalassiosira punctigera, Strain Tpunct2005C2" /NCGR_SAMPLE_ID=MMETSP1067 /ASSEMBLY_ACC=CAM_ASM_000444 /LENGTH=279 /DNA_ID=CAMNT_0013371927 /DNA_START=69 /DNA_END=905 /DNA_ORIENTATION=+
MAPSQKRLEGRRGVVRRVYMNVDSGGIVYKVEKSPLADDHDGDASSRAREGGSEYLPEDQLAYAMSCPVMVKGMLEGEPEKELGGVIVCPKPGKGDRKLSYTVQLLLGGNCFRVELGVKTEQIAFRNELETTQRRLSKKPTKTAGGTDQTGPLNKASKENISIAATDRIKMGEGEDVEDRSRKETERKDQARDRENKTTVQNECDNLRSSAMKEEKPHDASLSDHASGDGVSSNRQKQSEEKQSDVSCQRPTKLPEGEHPLSFKKAPSVGDTPIAGDNW